MSKPVGAAKLGRLGSSVFAEVASWRSRAEASGIDVIDLSIGSPDLPPSERVMRALSEAALDPASYRYPSSHGSELFRRKAAEWMRHRFGVELDPDEELLALMGSQDGLAHLALALCEPGDAAIVPDPGYPVYAASLALAGAEPILLPLKAGNGFLPDPDLVPDEAWERARFVLLGLPGNPIGAASSRELLEALVAKCRRHGVVLVHDLAYSEMGYGGYRPISALSVPGALDVAVEFHSMSKSFHMAGCRLGFLAGSREAVGALRRLKANIDYGVFGAVQRAAAEALDEAMEPGYSGFRHIYESRRDALVRALGEAGWPVEPPEATMFLWAAVPQPADGARTSSRRFAERLLAETGVAVVPGDAFGGEGEGYVRIALVEDEARLIEAAARIARWLPDYLQEGG
ncbi:aminotransferase class I/II-fold pyridoxal phosphate-dependent enzyme [Paenibacillus sp. B01]|uniref:aminotransferase class I/II-fold pyridoxal phosphate-dependent enzyme n=1 Tax=Paenibacillus sp. B01 TaxID=2660554 RepID=UPI00129BC60B|nr:aminotransferase class I/II-fold pyridoxal phosphate-dependent enzyme [Paenibacillus sp. B01]QGG55510.1 aminotransferase class I/II-fold pyridoxal phosphate-dependent enzyme [Paenibacillus sp. B01]